MLDKGFLNNPDTGLTACENKKDKLCTQLTLLNTNARSLTPKIDSLLDCMNEVDASVVTVTETWLRSGERMEESVRDLSLGAGVGMLHKNRDPASSNGVCYGGVAILWKESFGSFRNIQFKNPKGHEVLVGAGSMKGHRRKLVVIACYIPPMSKKFWQKTAWLS